MTRSARVWMLCKMYVLHSMRQEGKNTSEDDLLVGRANVIHALTVVSQRRAWDGPLHTPFSQSAESPEKGYQSCHVEPFARLLRPLSSVLGSLRLFHLTPPHIAL